MLHVLDPGLVRIPIISPEALPLCRGIMSALIIELAVCAIIGALVMFFS